MLAQYCLYYVALPQSRAALIGAAEMVDEALQHGLQVIEVDR